MSDCNKCLSKGDMGKCQNFKSVHYGERVPVAGECEVYERDGAK